MIYKTFCVVETEMSSLLIPVRLIVEVRTDTFKIVETKMLPSMYRSETSYIKNPTESMNSSILITIIQGRPMCLVVQH